MQLRNNIDLHPLVIRNGILDRTGGLCVTSDEALCMARSKDALDMGKRGEKERREAEKAEGDAAMSDKVKKMRVAHGKEALEYRVRQYGMREVLPRPIKERCMLAKRIVAEKKVYHSMSIGKRRYTSSEPLF